MICINVTVTSVPARIYTVEEINAALYTLENIVGVPTPIRYVGFGEYGTLPHREYDTSAYSCLYRLRPPACPSRLTSQSVCAISRQVCSRCSRQVRDDTASSPWACNEYPHRSVLIDTKQQLVLVDGILSGSFLHFIPSLAILSYGHGILHATAVRHIDGHSSKAIAIVDARLD